MMFFFICKIVINYVYIILIKNDMSFITMQENANNCIKIGDVYTNNKQKCIILS